MAVNSKLIFERVEPENYTDPVKIRLVFPIQLGGYTIPAGFESDGLTMPPFLRALYSPFGKGLKAAILHDYLLEETELSREQCAEEFRLQLQRDKIKKSISKVMYLGVKLWDLKSQNKG